MARDTDHTMPAPHDRASDEAEFSTDGVDLTLIRWMLSMSPAQRLGVLQQHVNSVLRLRRGRTGNS